MQLKKINKKAQVLDLSRKTILSLMIIVVIAVVGIVTVVSLLNTNILTNKSAEDNLTDTIKANYTQGVADFFAQVPTALKILAVAFIIAVIAIILVIVKRAGGGGGGGL